MRAVRSLRRVAELTVFGLLASGVVVAGSGSGASTVGTPPAAVATVPASAGAVCADVLLLAARGSGEGRAAPVGRQFGGTLNGFRSVYAASMAAQGRTLEQRSVSFSAPLVGTLRPAWATGRTPTTKALRRPRVAAWARGVTAGVSDAVGQLTQAAVTCPNQQIVLVGFAQGAMVLHRTVLALATRPDILDRVAGVALVANGDRRPLPAASGLVGAPAAPRNGNGANAGLQRFENLPVRGSNLAVWNVCTRGDVVCDVRANPLRQALKNHRGYRSGAGQAKVKAVALRLAQRTGRWPLPAATPVQITAERGLLVDRRLPVRVLAEARRDVAFAVDPAQLPPGVTLSSDGRLRGVPTQAGTFQITYTVRNAAKAVFARRSAGTATLVVGATSTRGISAGGEQTCETRADGSARCWGRNNWGQLGNGLTATSRVPVATGFATDWRSISTNGSTTCGVKENGQLWCWGLNEYGQIGDGTTTTRTKPVRVGAASNWATVSTGWGHTCATRTTGTAFCWGYNAGGQLGDGTTTRRGKPRRVGDRADWVSVSAGGWYSCGVTADGLGWCWGTNGFGQLGNGTVTGSNVPVRVGSATNWQQISASWMSACGVKADGELRCWGVNDRGQLGDGTRTTRRNPTPVSGGARYTTVSAGDAHTCAITVSGDLQCWGDNIHGQLNTGTRIASNVPVTSGTPGGWYSVDAGWNHSCAVKKDSTTWCWGNNDFGQVGDGSLSSRRVAVPVS